MHVTHLELGTICAGSGCCVNQLQGELQAAVVVVADFRDQK